MNDRAHQVIRYYDQLWSKGYPIEPLYGWGYHQSRIHSIIFRLLRSRINKETLVLEVGCGQGDLTSKLSELEGKLVAFDISRIGILKTRERVSSDCNLSISDATKLPFKSNQFDIVIISEVLEHIVAQQKCINELDRVIKPGGFLILTTPNAGGFHRTFIKVIYKLLNKPFKPSSQILDHPLYPSELHRMLSPSFQIEMNFGFIYTLPFIEKVKCKNIILLNNHISEYIEQKHLLSNEGLYQVLLCRSLKGFT